MLKLVKWNQSIIGNVVYTFDWIQSLKYLSLFFLTIQTQTTRISLTLFSKANQPEIVWISAA